MKRFFDILLSFIALLFLMPLLLFVMFILRFTGEGEVFFCQERVGRFGRKFKLYKFATMQKNSPAIESGTITVKDDPRVLPVGRLLRKTKINELPQLLNILCGDMSLIGPRPLTDQAFRLYPKEVQEIIKNIVPGLSGIGSIVFRKEEEILCNSGKPLIFYDEFIAPYKGSLEIWYSQNNSFATYIKLIYITLVVVVFPNSNLVWSIFDNLPKPPEILRDSLNFSRL
jgi:lipopolysaccharide/colanic/teichoic acid biosynthesis glycosyltransferase